MAIQEAIEVSVAGVGEVNALAGALDKAAESAARLNGSLAGGGGAGKLAASLEGAAGKVDAAVSKMEASFARLGGIGKAAAGSMADIGKVAADSAAGLGKLADAEKAASDTGARLGKSSAGAADGIKGLGDSTKRSSAWLDEYNATMAESAAMQKDFARVSTDANAKIAMGQRLGTAEARAASADAVKAQKAQKAAAVESAAAAEASSRRWKMAGLGAGAVIAYGVDQAAKLQAGITRLYTTAGESKANLPMISSGILKLAPETATSQAQLLQGAYMAESAGFHGKSALNVLKAGAEGAYAEGAPLGDTINALTSMMNAYGMRGAGAPVSAMDQIIAMVSRGKMTMAGAVSALPTVLPVAAQAGLNFGQVGGALSTMTAMGTSPDLAAQHLSHTIGSLQNMSGVQVKEIQQLGGDPVKLEKNLGKTGLLGTLTQINDLVTGSMGKSGTVLMRTFSQSASAAADANQMIGAMPPSIRGVAKAYADGSISAKAWNKEVFSGSESAQQKNLLQQFATVENQAKGFNNLLKSGSPAAQTYEAALSKALGGQTGLQTFLSLEGIHLPAAMSNTAAVTQAGKHPAADVTGWPEVQKTLKFQFGSAEQALQSVATEMGKAFLPLATTGLKGLADVGKFFSGHETLTKDLGILAGGGLGLKLGKQFGSAILSEVGSVGKALRIPGLSGLANIGKNAGLGGAAAELSGAGAELSGAAAELSGAAARLAGAPGLPGGLPVKAGGAAAGEAAAAGTAGETVAASAGMLTAPLLGAGAGLALGLYLDKYHKYDHPAPAGQQGPRAPAAGSQAWRQYDAAPPPKQWYSVTGSDWAQARTNQSQGPTLQGIAAHPGVQLKPAKVPAPDTSALSAAQGKVTAAISAISSALGKGLGKPAKLPPPDMSAFLSASGKAGALGTGITSAIQGSMKPAKMPAPNLSAAQAAQGKAQGIGAGISAGLASGIMAGEGAVVAAATAVGNAAAAAMARAAATHSPSKKTKKTGQDMAAGLEIGLQGGQAAVTAAATALGKNAAKAADIAAIDNTAKKLLGEVPKGDTGLVKLLKSDNRQLDSLANQRAKLEAEITGAGQISQSVVSGASVMNALNAVNPAGAEPLAGSAVVTGMQYQAQQAAQFADQVGKLQKMGLNATSLSQIVQAGPDQGLGIAQGISSSGAGTVKQLNMYEKQIQASAAKIGDAGAPAMYQAGKDSLAGLASGLKADLGQIDKTMEKIAHQMVASVSKHAKTAKGKAAKAAAGAVTDSAAAGTSAASGSASGSLSAGAGTGGLSHAAASLSAAGARLSSAAAALSAAASSLKRDGTGGVPGLHKPPVAHPAAAAAGYGGGAHPAAAAAYGGSSGGAVHYHDHTTVHVAGNVTTERDLLSSLQQRQLSRASNNWQGGWKLPGRGT